MPPANSIEIDPGKIIRGDMDEFERLYRFYCQSLVLFTMKYIPDQAIAENIVQDVFYMVLQNREKLDPDTNFKTYLYTCVKNRALNLLKHKKVEERFFQSCLQLEETNWNTPEQQVLLAELEKRLNIAINKLPPRCRMIFIMKRQDHMTYQEIADILDLSPKTVENQVSRAIKILRKHLADLLPLQI